MSRYDTASTHSFDIMLTEIKPKTGTISDIQVMSIPIYDLLTRAPNTRGISIYIRTKYQARQVTPKIQESFKDSV